MPYLCPENSANCTALYGSEMSQTRTFGMWPHSPVAKYLPSPARAREVTVFRQAFNTWAWVFFRGLNKTTVQLKQRKFGRCLRFYSHTLPPLLIADQFRETVPLQILRKKNIFQWNEAFTAIAPFCHGYSSTNLENNLFSNGYFVNQTHSSKTSQLQKFFLFASCRTSEE